MVSELLAVGYRNIDAKNHDSQTAAHIAAYHGHTAVLECLVKHRAKVRITRDIIVTISRQYHYKTQVNITDTGGYSPLQYAAMADQAAAVRVLLERAGANPTMRNEQTRSWLQANLHNLVIMM